MSTIKNVSKRAAKAIYELEVASDKLEKLHHKLNDEELRDWLEALKYIESAQKEMCRILMQDLKVEN